MPKLRCSNFLLAVPHCLSTGRGHVPISEQLFPSLGERSTTMKEARCLQNIVRGINDEETIWNISAQMRLTLYGQE
jgi:hypothetical protein